MIILQLLEKTIHVLTVSAYMKRNEDTILNEKKKIFQDSFQKLRIMTETFLRCNLFNKSENNL